MSGLVNREFAWVVADGNVYCYEMEKVYGGGVLVVLVQPRSATELWMEKTELQSCGTEPWVFGVNVGVFER